ncbi:STAS domain-containing protein [Caulifigura coniformis]|uniref:STAS domain-containing protein n=1 Tax=Caulifigura coniformis TaxID=2527983 RepID=UPI00119D96FB|nr:STAS domain-containing protein [Caulifigura coniformis]
MEGLHELALFASRINRALKVEIEQRTIVVTPGNELDSVRYQEIHLEVGRINDLVRHGGFRNLLIDLSARPVLEAVIQTALVGFCRAIPGQAAFCGISDTIQNSMNVSKLAGLWPTYATRAEAIEALNSQTDGCSQTTDGVAGPNQLIDSRGAE